VSRQLAFQRIWQHISIGRTRTFIRYSGGAVNYGVLANLVTRFCALFDRNKLSEGDRVLIVTANEMVASAAFVAAMLDGLVPVMLSADSKDDRVKAIFESVSPALVVVDRQLAGKADGGNSKAFMTAVPALNVPSATMFQSHSGIGAKLRNILNRDRPATVDAELGLPGSGREPRLPQVDDTIAYVLFTSGTSKLPSGVQISRNALIAQLETLTRLFDYDSDSRIFNATPFSHTDGLVQGLLLAVANQAALLRPGPFSLPDLENWLDRLAEFEATHFITNPTVLTLIDRFAAHDDYFGHAGFFSILSSASILRADFWAKFESRFGCSIYNLYGMTETVANATYAGRHPEMGPVGTIGFPVDCEVRLVDSGANGRELVSDREGEIQIRGENVFQGYWKDPARTATTLVDGGWMRTGDLAKRRDDGAFQIIGRLSAVINMGGQSIVPEEIDEALASHPAVLDVATVGMSDSEFDEIAVSAVVLESPASESELIRFCRQHLEQLKVPKRIIAIDEIPRGGAGKPKSAELRTLLAPLMAHAARVPATDDSASVSAGAIYELAAEVFHVPAEDLHADSSAATVKGWDSFNQLNLLIEAERRFDVRIPASQAARIRTLGDLHQAITRKQ